MRELVEKLGARFSRGSIRYAMFASFTVSALLAIVLTGMTLYVRFSAQLNAAIEGENQMLVDQVNQSLGTYLRDMIRLSDSIYYNVVKNTGLNCELDAIAACVIGGVIFVGLNMAGVPQDLFYLVKGGIILFACALDMRKYLTKK